MVEVEAQAAPPESVTDNDTFLVVEGATQVKTGFSVAATHAKVILARIGSIAEKLILALVAECLVAPICIVGRIIIQLKIVLEILGQAGRGGVARIDQRLTQQFIILSGVQELPLAGGRADAVVVARRYFGLALFAFLGRDNNYAIGGPRAIDSRSRGILQNADALDVVRVEVG